MVEGGRSPRGLFFFAGGREGLKGEAGMLGQVSSKSSLPLPPRQPPWLCTFQGRRSERRGRGGGGQGAESSPTYSE